MDNEAFKSAGRVADVLHKDIVVEVGARTGKERGSVWREGGLIS